MGYPQPYLDPLKWWLRAAPSIPFLVCSSSLSSCPPSSFHSNDAARYSSVSSSAACGAIRINNGWTTANRVEDFNDGVKSAEAEKFAMGKQNIILHADRASAKELFSDQHDSLLNNQSVVLPQSLTVQKSMKSTTVSLRRRQPVGVMTPTVEPSEAGTGGGNFPHTSHEDRDSAPLGTAMKQHHSITTNNSTGNANTLLVSDLFYHRQNTCIGQLRMKDTDPLLWHVALVEYPLHKEKKKTRTRG